MDYKKLNGIAVAMELARSGKMIFAIKHIEKENPELSRDESKAVVESFGYGKRSRPPIREDRR